LHLECDDISSSPAHNRAQRLFEQISQFNFITSVFAFAVVFPSVIGSKECCASKKEKQKQDRHLQSANFAKACIL